MTYSRNIARLKEKSRENLRFSSQERVNAATREGNQRIEEANDIATKLSGFSESLYQWKLQDIKEKEIEGKQAFEEVRTEKAEHAILKEEYVRASETKEFFELAGAVEQAKVHDVRYQELKGEMLARGGVDAYPEADRIAKLSEHQQVGYLKAKLGAFAETYGDKLNQSMQNSTQPIKVGNVTFTSAQLRENHISALPLKEAALRVHSKNIMKAAGLEKFSPEMLALAGVTGTMEKVHKSQMAKYRSRYNIDSSHNERIKATKNWNSIPAKERTGFDLYQLWLTHSNTVDGKNQQLGNAGGWDSVFSVLVKEGVQSGSTSVLDKYKKMKLPEQLRKSLGAKPGTTYWDKWPGRFEKARTDIMSGAKAAADAEKDFLQSGSTQLGNAFNKEARQGDISTDRLNWYKEQNRKLGGTLDSRIKQYETVSARDERVDTDRIKDVIASQNGYISNDQLDEFHPRAADVYREQATRQEAALKKKYNVDGQIKGALNKSWTDAGMKQKEKSVVWEYALANAQKDYETKFNRLVAMGYDAENASYLAMYGGMGQVIDKNTNEPLGDFEGVVANITRTGAASKYTQHGQQQKDSLKDAHLRMDAINKGKKEMLESPWTINQGIIGGDYGQERISEIVDSIKLHGTWKGIRRAEHALKYYEGLAQGKRGMWAYGLIDAQLKASGHPGIWPDRVEQDDPSNAVNTVNNYMQPLKYEGSLSSYNTVVNDSMELINYYSGNGSIYNNPENLVEWLQ